MKSQYSENLERNACNIGQPPPQEVGESAEVVSSHHYRDAPTSRSLANNLCSHLFLPLPEHKLTEARADAGDSRWILPVKDETQQLRETNLLHEAPAILGAMDVDEAVGNSPLTEQHGERPELILGEQPCPRFRPVAHVRPERVIVVLQKECPWHPGLHDIGAQTFPRGCATMPHP